MDEDPLLLKNSVFSCSWQELLRDFCHSQWTIPADTKSKKDDIVHTVQESLKTENIDTDKQASRGYNVQYVDAYNHVSEKRINAHLAIGESGRNKITELRRHCIRHGNEQCVLTYINDCVKHMSREHNHKVDQLAFMVWLKSGGKPQLKESRTLRTGEQYVATRRLTW